MRIKILLLFSLVILSGCYKKEKSQQIYTVAPDIDHWMKDSTGNYIKSIRFNHYGNRNIIIDSLDNFYYYSHKIPFSLVSDVVTEEQSIPNPPFIHLKPLDIIDLDEKHIEGFVFSNLVRENPSTFNTIVFSSVKDTFTSPTLDRVMSELARLKPESTLFMIRKITEEESVVLEHYKKGETYYDSSINWDTTKVDLQQHK